MTVGERFLNRLVEDKVIKLVSHLLGALLDTNILSSH